MSRAVWEQMVLASLTAVATWDSFWWSITPRSQRALHLLVSIDPLVLSRSLRALLTLVQSSAKSIKVLVLLLPEMAAIGEMLVGISSREASPLSMLAWDEVLAGDSRPSGLHGGDVRTTAVVTLLGSDYWDSQLDASNTAWDRRLLTSVVILPSDLGGDLGGLVIKTVGMSSRGGIFWSGSSIGGEGISISK